MSLALIGPRLRLVFAVGLHLKAADEQCRQDVLSLVIGPNADATSAWRDMRVIVGRNFVLTTVGRKYNKRLKWLSSQPMPNVLCHVLNLAKESPDAIIHRHKSGCY